jgi:Lrp/AsnC family leucine-responsive transcriptional regulator
VELFNIPNAAIFDAGACNNRAKKIVTCGNRAKWRDKVISPRRNRKWDRFDVALLNVVQENNQLTAEQFAVRVGLSSSACQRRLKRLRAEGMITADVSLVSPKATGPRVTLIVLVSVEREQADLFANFKRAMRSHGEITQCYYVTGSADFILVVNVASMEEYGAFAERVFINDKNVRAFQSYACMQQVKFTTKTPLVWEEDEE